MNLFTETSNTLLLTENVIEILTPGSFNPNDCDTLFSLFMTHNNHETLHSLLVIQHASAVAYDWLCYPDIVDCVCILIYLLVGLKLDQCYGI